MHGLLTTKRSISYLYFVVLRTLPCGSPRAANPTLVHCVYAANLPFSVLIFLLCFKQKNEILHLRLDNADRLMYNIPCKNEICGCSSSGRAPPCQGGGSEFQPRHPLQKKSVPIAGADFFCFNKKNQNKTRNCSLAASPLNCRELKVES